MTTERHLVFTYLKNGMKKKRSLGAVIADMPPEFDYDFEYERTKLFLDKS